MDLADIAVTKIDKRIRVFGDWIYTAERIRPGCWHVFCGHIFLGRVKNFEQVKATVYNDYTAENQDFLDS